MSPTYRAMKGKPEASWGFPRLYVADIQGYGGHRHLRGLLGCMLLTYRAMGVKLEAC